jgi:hypothetical protein
MAKDTTILQELREIAPALANPHIGLPFSAPEGYFNQFPEKMIQLAQKAQAVSEVPDGYFEQFAENMLGRVRSLEVQSELEEVAPLLNSLPKTMPHYVPESYFEKEITAPVEHQTAKIISIFTRKIYKWAAAASVVLMLGIGWLLTNQSNTGTENYASLSTEEISNMLGSMDENNLDNLIEKNAVETEFTRLLLVAEKDVEKSLNDVSTDELTYYLENHQVPEKGI